MATDPDARYRVDRNTLRTNQGFIVALTVLAFVLGATVGAWIVLATGLVMTLGTFDDRLALFKQVHRRVLKPLGILGANVHPEDPMPHQFAQAMGAAFLLAAAAALFADATPVGWTLNFIVTALAFINLAVNFCAGCFVYFQLDRRGLLPASIASDRALSAS
ncbi:MAG: DUF4395 domain-containing protein [Chloroflexi bacterium]|nr:DUF4395 domain-containing protein [Chloroflexota bacterium]MDA1148034.1 DUF4395 domain-containing protein [Chloroflexota bacterium]